MDEHKQERKQLKKAARRAKRKVVTVWKVFSMLLLVIALLATPLSLAVTVLDNVVATYLNEPLWKTVNEDANAAYFSMDFASVEELQAHLRELSAQVAAEGAVLLRNENNALPLSPEEKIRAFVDETSLLPNAVQDGDVAVLDRTDSELLQQLSAMKSAGEIKKIIVLLTEATPQLGFLKENPYQIDGVLWIGSSKASVEDILTGKVDPSGRLPKAFSDFSFGFGLSYTTFACSEMTVAYNEKTDRFGVTVTVQNAGSLPGKQTLQVYARSADGAVKLAGFAKTPLLAPGESRKVTVYADKQAFAAYIDGTYILNPGEYSLVLATDSHNARSSTLSYDWEQEEAAVFADGTVVRQPVTEMPTMGAQNNLKLYDMMGVSLDDPKWQTYLDQLTFGDMAAMLGDAYGGLPALESVQSPGTRNHTDSLPGGDMLAATFNTELAYEMGKAIGNDCLVKGVDCLDNPGGKIADFSEDSVLAGRICAGQVLGIQDKGIIVAVALDGQDPAAAKYVLREGKAGAVITDGAPYLGEFAGMVISEKTGVESLLAGVTVFDSLLPRMEQLEGYRTDPAVVSAMRRACQYNLYTIANSVAMNGFGKDTTVEVSVLPLVVICRAVAACSWVLFVIVVFLWARGKRKWRKTQAYLDYKTRKNTWNELKKTRRV